jgi:hypothetical protein
MMNQPAPGQMGYAFALPRLLARLRGRKVRRAEFSGGEAYGLGIVVFGMSCLFGARALLPVVRPVLLWALVLFLIPFAIWVAFLVLYYLNFLVVGGLRRLGLYSAMTNNPFQHFVIMALTSGIALHFLIDECPAVKSLGIFWLGLLSLNLFSVLVEKLVHEP